MCQKLIDSSTLKTRQSIYKRGFVDPGFEFLGKNTRQFFPDIVMKLNIKEYPTARIPFLLFKVCFIIV